MPGEGLLSGRVSVGRENRAHGALPVTQGTTPRGASLDHRSDTTVMTTLSAEHVAMTLLHFLVCSRSPQDPRML